ncbi:33874_t:CDS:2, partial [Racocetra persica]
MLLAKIGPNLVFDCSSDLGYCDIDQNHDWTNNARQYYSNTDLGEASSFMQKVSNHNESNNDIKGNKISNTKVIDYEILNDKQKTIFSAVQHNNFSQNQKNLSGELE